MKKWGEVVYTRSIACSVSRYRYAGLTNTICLYASDFVTSSDDSIASTAVFSRSTGSPDRRESVTRSGLISSQCSLMAMLLTAFYDFPQTLHIGVHSFSPLLGNAISDITGSSGDALQGERTANTRREDVSPDVGNLRRSYLVYSDCETGFPVTLK